MALFELIVAAAGYALGGFFMKLSHGLSRPLPSISFLVLFVASASLQAVAMRRVDLGLAYIFVLGVEALFTLGLSLFALHESWSPARLGAVMLVLVGIAWLSQT
ncbi:MAG TPA: SMR family transporter [Candidatus Binataceae bacterium]|nr:SMR family transporter [Candidatus Binataceae bacterium]